ncbi:MAG TPA: glycerol-3-phosphate 1-O-acyltransferase PlsY [Candidatus Acidoferrales bacterium]|nr:glycerol-3-phosphate 1-O-acyltransferase PlsY [Candidatus Acidoferrales bacterium]
MIVALAILIGYLVGSIPFGLWIGRYAAGADVRRRGSGNIGAANVARVAGPAAGLATLLLDGSKGAVAVWLGATLGQAHPGAESTRMVVAGLAAIVGHMFPAWLRFHGGRGVATAMGVFLVIGWMAVAADLVIWLGAMAIWRYASLSSMLWAAALPLLMRWLYAPGHYPPTMVSAGTVIAALLVIWRHRANLRRLVEGAEPRFNFRR